VEKDLVEYIAKSLVDDPGAVSVSEVEGEKSTILELRVAPEDIGKVIGKYGRIAKAMRTVLSAAAGKSGNWVTLERLDCWGLPLVTGGPTASSSRDTSARPMAWAGSSG